MLVADVPCHTRVCCQPVLAVELGTDQEAGLTCTAILGVRVQYIDGASSPSQSCSRLTWADRLLTCWKWTLGHCRDTLQDSHALVCLDTPAMHFLHVHTGRCVTLHPIQ